MGATIRHRGPDDQGVEFGRSWALGNQRLSVIDPEGGHQPMQSDDGQITVVQNGEIFNYVELRNELRRRGFTFRTSSDTEVILRMYEWKGLEAIPEFNGMFSIAIHDGRTGQLHLVRDRIGIKPLYFHDDGEILLFASEIKSLLAAGIPRIPDPESISDFLTFNFCPPPRTVFQNVRQVEPGHHLTVSRDAPSVSTRWWDLSRVQPVELDEREWSRRIMEVLGDAVRIRLRSDVPFGAFLSGGIDSSTIVGLMSGILEEPAKTFSIGFGDPRFDESPYAEEAAKRFNTEHYGQVVESNVFSMWPMTIYHCDQPHGDASFMPTYLVSRLAREKVTVVLTGDGGDELFAGYKKYKDFFSANPDWVDELKSLPEECRFREAYYASDSVFDDTLKSRIFTKEARKVLAGHRSFDAWLPYLDRVRHFDPINQVLYLDMMQLLPGNNLVKPDRMGMAVSLEARAPFLDYRMMELAFQIPGEMKLRNGETKAILKSTVSDLIGNALAYRRKQMFTVPIGEWFKGPLFNPIQRFILSEQALSRGLFEREVLNELLESHREERANYTRQLRAVVALEIWHRIFIDRSDVSIPDAESVFGEAALDEVIV